MRLFEAIIDANHCAGPGQKTAAVSVADFAGSLPVVALTCIDPRLNALMPAVLGLPQEQFIWLRNAGNIITSSMSSTVRSVALACAIKGGREIAIIGHTDCRVGQTTMLELTERFRSLGVDRPKLPDNLVEFFGVFASERQNVLKAVDYARHSPLIGPKVPVHGLMVDIQSGRLEWLVNGYQALEAATAQGAALASAQLATMQSAFASPEPDIGEMKPQKTRPVEPARESGWSVKDAKVVEVPPQVPPRIRLVEHKPDHPHRPPPATPPARNRPPRKFQ